MMRALIVAVLGLLASVAPLGAQTSPVWPQGLTPPVFIVPASTGSGSGLITSVTGTANQITCSPTTGAVICGTPQDIATASTPQFLRLGLGQAANAAVPFGITSSQVSGTNAFAQFTNSDTSTDSRTLVKFYSNATLWADMGAEGNGSSGVPGDFYIRTSSTAPILFLAGGTTRATVDTSGITVAASHRIASPLFQSTTAKVLLQGTGTGATQVSTTQTTQPTCTTNCGSPNNVCAGTDTFMTCTMGTTPASGFVIAFNGTWAAAPACSVTMALAGMVAGKLALTVATTTGQITVVTNGTAPSTSDKYHIQCGGIQ